MVKYIIRYGIIIIMLFIAIGIMRNYTLHELDKKEDILHKKILHLHRNSILNAQETGTLQLYDPVMSFSEDKHTLLLEVFSLLFQKDRIHRVVFDGNSSYIIDKSMIEYLASMPDIEALEMQGVMFNSDDVFTPFTGISTFSSLDIRNSVASIELYKSIFREKGIKRLTILSPNYANSNDDQPRKLFASEIQSITREIANATHIDYLLLDTSFFEYKAEFVPFLPNTTVEFGSISPYDGKVLYTQTD